MELAQLVLYVIAGLGVLAFAMYLAVPVVNAATRVVRYLNRRKATR